MTTTKSTPERAPIVVGWEDAERSGGALAFAASLAVELDATILLARVYPASRSRGPASDARERQQRAVAEAALDEATPLLAAAAPAELRAIAARSVAGGLHELAEQRAAALLVVASSRRRAAGRLLSGTASIRLAHGAPCPVAIVPRGYRAPGFGLRTIAVAVDGGEEARRAVDVARAIAVATRATLRLIAVAEPPVFGGVEYATGITYEAIMDETRAELRSVLGETLARLPTKLAAATELYDGHAARTLAEHAADAELLVVGSRGYGPLGRVLMGSVGAHLAHAAPCPLLVVPRGASDGRASRRERRG